MDCETVKEIKKGNSKMSYADISGLELYEMSYEKGETLFKQGTIVPHIVFIKKGMVKVILESNQRKQPLCIERKDI